MTGPVILKEFYKVKRLKNLIVYLRHSERSKESNNRDVSGLKALNMTS